MSLSAGTKNATGMAASWIIAGAICLGTFYYYEDIRPHVAAAFGVPVGLSSNDAGPLDAAGDATPAGGTVQLRAGGDGHFHATAYMNGRPVEVMVDTGASVVALSHEDAERAGIFLKDSDFTHKVNTANGVAKVAPVTIAKIEIEDITVRNVEGVVSERGRLNQTLLGMAFLNRLNRAEIRKGLLILEQ